MTDITSIAQRMREAALTPGEYTILFRDNWDGEGDTYKTLATLDEDGVWRNENGVELLKYEGDAVLKAWTLDDRCDALSQRDAQIVSMDSRIRQQNRHVCELFDEAKALRAQLAQRDAQIAALTAENVALKSSIPAERFIDVMNENMDDVSLAEDVGFNRAVRKMITASAETPATDAACNALRAEGLERGVTELKDLAERSDREAPKAAEQIHAAALYLMIFANQLREGKA